MKRQRIWMHLAALALALAAGSAHAGNVGRVGTAAAPELRIPVGSRGTALGGSILASVRGVDALYWNPAGLVLGDQKREVIFSYLDYIADMKLNYFGIGAQVSGDIALGLSAKVFSVGDIIVTTEEEPEGTGEVLSPTFSVVALTYSHRLTDRVLFGASLKYIHEGIKRETARALAFDFGLQYLTGFRGLTLGVAIRNLGQDMRFDGPDLEENVQLSSVLTAADPQAAGRNFRTSLAAAELPTSIELGLAYDLFETAVGKAVFSAAFRNNNLAADEYQAGVEYQLKQMLQLRGGYVLSPEGGVQPSGFKKQFILGPTFGVGLSVPVGDTRFKVDYTLARTDFFQDNHWLTVGLGF